MWPDPQFPVAFTEEIFYGKRHYFCSEEYNIVAGSHQTFTRAMLEKVTQLTFTCSTSTIETLEKGVKYVQS